MKEIRIEVFTTEYQAFLLSLRRLREVAFYNFLDKIKNSNISLRERLFCYGCLFHFFEFFEDKNFILREIVKSILEFFEVDYEMVCRNEDNGVVKYTLIVRIGK